MNGIEKITGRILDDARAQREAALAQAQQQAQQIAQQSSQQAQQRRQQLEQQALQTARQQEQRLVSSARMDAQRQLLGVKQELVEQAYDLALQKLCSLPREEYIRVLAQLLDKASSTGTEQAVFSARDRQVGQQAVDEVNRSRGKHLTVAEQTGEMAGGFLLLDKNTRVNCTFETLVRLNKSETAAAVANMLFG